MASHTLLPLAWGSCPTFGSLPMEFYNLPSTGSITSSVVGDPDGGVGLQAANEGSYVEQVGTAVFDPGIVIYFEDDGVIPGGATINSVTLQVRVKSSGTANLDFWASQTPFSFTSHGVGDTPVAATGGSAVSAAYSTIATAALTTNPATSAAWVRSDLFDDNDAGSFGNGGWRVIVDVSAVGGSTVDFDYAALVVDYSGSAVTLSSIDVATGPVTGDTLITLTGTNFGSCSAPTVSIGGATAFGTVVNSTTMTIRTPQHFDINMTDPIVDVTVSCSGDTSTLTNAFTWTPVWFDFAVPDDLDLDIEPFHFYGYGYPDLLDLDWLRLTLGFTLEDWRRLLIRFPTFTWWTPSTTPDTHGWYYSTANFGGDVYVVDSTDRPVNPRKWSQIATFATGATNMLGGSPGAAAVKNNRLYYAAGNYTTSTDLPPIRILKGGSDYQLATVPKTDSGGVPYTIISMLAANDTIYVATIDSGSSSADWLGRVFEFDTKSGQMTKIGATFPTGHIPYALEFHNGRLWVGTHKQTAAGVGRVYYFRPGIDTDWTLDLTLASGNVACMRGFQGQLYIGTTNAAASRGLVRQRTTAGVWSTVQTGSGGTAKDGNGYIALTEFSDKLYASYWNDDTTPVSKIEKSSDGSSWSTSYTGASGTNRPFIGLVSDSSYLFAVGGGTARTAALVRTPDGTTWTNLTGFLPDTTETFVPVFGVMVR